ncbi:MAG: MBL fold metallo-hydrolase [Bacilli bacterium]|nr:MBL fold metallo-hydrolase [Bacilli bacterium]
MKFRILGSGGMYTTPLPHCHCKTCESARCGNEKDIRSMPAFYLEDIKLLIDTPEDIFNTLNKSRIDDIDYLSLSHRDPDHTRGIRVIEGMYYNHQKEIPLKTVSFFALPEVIDDTNNMMGNTLKFYEKRKNVIKIEACNKKVINDISISLLDNYTNERLHIANYVFEKDGKKLIYACCNAKPFREYEKYYDADVLIISMVDLTKIDNPNRKPYKFDDELFSIDEIIELKNKYNIKRVICTHIDCAWGNTYDVLKEYENNLDGIEFAYDGMEINL